ncbi:MAG: DNA adenine methylase [Proteobacteria bacterium]|nr:DNA adenine methylase [Pseudomonadota bacterium]
MSVSIPYMGNKQWLASDVARIVADLKRGPILDLFSGMCSIAQAVGTNRAIWCNEKQAFPALVASSLLQGCSPPTKGDIAVLEKYYAENLVSLWSRFGVSVQDESDALASGSLTKMQKASFELPFVGTNLDFECERLELAGSPKQFPYRLFCITYAGSYFGIFQSMQLDSLRYAINKASHHKKNDRKLTNWLLVCLGISAIRCNNATGHFAQYLNLTNTNKKRVLGQRSRSVWTEFILALGQIAPLGTPKWRLKNRCFKGESLGLLSRLRASDLRPTVIYADPPYSEAQYSRYYHLLDTLLTYNYPTVEGKGRYPPDRFQTSFSHKKTVHKSMKQLVLGSARLEADLVISYPSNGLFVAGGGDVLDLLNDSYQEVCIAKTVSQFHSSFGGPKAKPRAMVKEHIYVARGPNK